MEIIGFLLFGLVVGALARFLMPGDDPMGIIGTTLLGIAGALAGGLVANALGDNDGVGWIGALLGAMAVLFIYRSVGRRTA